MHAAAMNGHESVVFDLISAGANANHSRGTATPLHLAAMNDHPDVDQVRWDADSSHTKTGYLVA